MPLRHCIYVSTSFLSNRILTFFDIWTTFFAFLMTLKRTFLANLINLFFRALVIKFSLVPMDTVYQGLLENIYS